MMFIVARNVNEKIIYNSTFFNCFGCGITGYGISKKVEIYPENDIIVVIDAPMIVNYNKRRYNK